MKKILFSAFFSFFLLSCSQNKFEENRKSGSSESFWDDEEDLQRIENEWNTGVGDQIKNICGEDQFVIYSRNDCPEIQRGRNGGYNIIMDPNDSHPNTIRRPVDILFVLNASSSMWYYLTYTTSSNNKHFHGRFRSFISTMNEARLDWRIFFTNSDYSSGFLKRRNGKAMNLEGKFNILNSKILDRTTNDYLNVFTYTMTRGPNHSGNRNQNNNECSRPPYCGNVRPLKALKASFASNKDLTRQEADFIAVIISNTDDEKNVTPDDVITEFRKVYGFNKNLSVLSLIILPGDGKCHKINEDRTFPLYYLWQKTSPGHKIARLAKETGGGNFSICLEDYSIMAETIVTLSSVPDPQ